jgi:hypothetical protein
MRLRQWLGMGLSLLVGSLAGCQEHWTDYLTDVYQCDTIIEDALNSTEWYAMDTHVAEAQAELETRVSAADRHVTMQQVVDQALVSCELCGVPKLESGDIGFAGLFIPDFNEEVEVDGEMKYFDKVVVFNESSMWEILARRGYTSISYLLDFYVEDEGKFVLSEELIKDYFMESDSLYSDYSRMRSQFSDLYLFFGDIAGLDVHEYTHQTLFEGGYDYWHPISHEEIQEDPELTYLDDVVTNYDQSFDSVLIDPESRVLRGEWIKDIYCDVSEEKGIVDDHYVLHCITWG